VERYWKNRKRAGLLLRLKGNERGVGEGGTGGQEGGKNKNMEGDVGGKNEDWA